MQPIFTIHAGELIVADQIQSKFQKTLNVWVPGKDSGIDLLVTDRTNKRTVSLQVKHSRCYAYPGLTAEFDESLAACGWWRLDEDKIKSSPADLWVFVIVGTRKPAVKVIILPPSVLLAKLRKLRPHVKGVQSHLWVTANGDECWETMGLTKQEKAALVFEGTAPENRRFTKYLNDWSRLEELATDA